MPTLFLDTRSSLDCNLVTIKIVLLVSRKKLISEDKSLCYAVQFG